MRSGVGMVLILRLQLWVEVVLVSFLATAFGLYEKMFTRRVKDRMTGQFTCCIFEKMFIHFALSSLC